MSRFEELLLRCALEEERDIIVTMFINGLRAYLKRELLYYSPNSLKNAYTRAMEIEKYNGNFVVCHTSYQEP